MVLLGAHISIAGGVHKALIRGASLGCTTIQIFVKNARMWKSKPLTSQIIDSFKKNCQQTGISPIVAHSIYLVNLASEESELRKKSLNDMRDEMTRCDLLGIPFLVMHPGTHKDERIGLKLIADALDQLYTEPYEVSVTLETTAGQGNNLGYKFEQIAEIIDNANCKDKLSVCLDTCHSFAAGEPRRDIMIHFGSSTLS